MAKIKAPFTDEQVKNLNAFQHDGRFHEFTCANESVHSNGSVLIATHDGWTCPSCSYTQDWAHDFMAEPLQVTKFSKWNSDPDDQV